jgi:hypothetical protein
LVASDVGAYFYVSGGGYSTGHCTEGRREASRDVGWRGVSGGRRRG